MSSQAVIVIGSESRVHDVFQISKVTDQAAWLCLIKKGLRIRTIDTMNDANFLKNIIF
jgi:hypothetical protein